MKTVHKLILLILMITNISYSQSTEERIKQLEDWRIVVDSVLSLTVIDPSPGVISPIPFDTIPILSSMSADVIWFPYTPIRYENNKFYLYYLWGGVPVFSESQTGNGLTWWYPQTYSTTRGETIIKVGSKWYMSFHKWVSGICRSYFSISYDGKNFTEIQTNLTGVATGEDRTLFYDEASGKFRMYIRPTYRPFSKEYPRNIAYSESSDFINWTSPRVVLTPDAQDTNTQFYSLQVFKANGYYYGLLNTIRTNNYSLDVEQNPPYSDNDLTVDCQIVRSLNGIENWERLNERKPFIKRKPGYKQLFALGTVVGNKLRIYTIETKRRHSDYENAIVGTTKHYLGIWLYELSLENLANYK